MALPLVAVSAGDPGGVGPELVARALKDPAVRGACRAVVFGDPAVLRARGFSPALGELVPVPLKGAPRIGKITAAQGAASFKALALAADYVRDGRAAALVTAPVCKEAWDLARVGHVGHTDFFQTLTRVPRLAMMFAAGELRAALVTDHIPLRRVPRAATGKAAADVARLVYRELGGRLGIAAPRVAVCGLNPHAGENGLLGDEEKKTLAPALRRLRREFPVEGPLPADAAWAGMSRGRYDALVCLYHDQALMPLKVRSPYGVVHWTLGLPFVRTSPAHGTAFDIAGRGLADPAAMIGALLFAVRLSRAGAKP